MEKLDIYGSAFNFTINRKSHISTKIGVIFSMITLGVFIFTFYSFGQDLFYKTHPFITIQEKSYRNEELIIMNSTTIPNRTIVVVVEEKIDGLVSFITENTVPGTNQDVQNHSLLEYCDDEWVLQKFYSDNNTYGREELIIKKFYCWKLNEFNFGMLDTANTGNNYYIMPACIYTIECDSTHHNVKTRPCRYKLADFINLRSMIQVWVEKIIFQPDNYTHPFEPTYIMSQIRATTMQEVNLQLSLSRHNNTDDDGFILTNRKTSLDLGASGFTWEVFQKNKPDFHDITVLVGYDKVYAHTSRIYMKVQDFAANLGGILEIIVGFFELFFIFYNKYAIDEYLLRLYYDSTDFITSNQILKINSIRSNINREISLEMNNLSPTKKVSFKNNLFERKHSSINPIEKSFQSPLNRNFKYNNFFENKLTHTESKIIMLKEIKNNFKLSFNLYIKYLFCKKYTKDRKGKLVFNNMDEIQKYKSVEYVYQCIKEINSMKNLLLTPEQAMSLKFTNKPSIYQFDEESHPKKEEEKVYNYFLKAYIDKCLTKNDEFLFNNLKGDLKNKILKEASLRSGQNIALIN